MMWQRVARWLAAGAGLTLALGTVQAVAQPARAGGTVMTIGSSEVEATFAEPRYSEAGGKPVIVPDRRIIDQLKRLIHDTPAGGTIRLAIHSFSLADVLAELKAAVNRKVHVYVVHNGADRGARAQALATFLHQHRANGNGNTWCTHGNAKKYGTGCLSTNPHGIMHAKYATFTRTKDAAGRSKADVTWFGSANETGKTGLNAFNNTITVYGDKTLYQHFNKLWTTMKGQHSFPHNNFYAPKAGRGYFASDASDTAVYVSPEHATSTDLLAGRLADINPGKDCQVRFLENNIHHNNGVRGHLFDQLKRLHAGGCRMYAVAGNADHDARCALYHDHITTHQDRTALGKTKQVTVHDKAVIIKARYGGSKKPRYIILTGSHNLTKSALRYNDELLVKIHDSSSLYQAFKNHFDAAYSTSSKYPVPPHC